MKEMGRHRSSEGHPALECACPATPHTPFPPARPALHKKTESVGVVVSVLGEEEGEEEEKRM